MASRTRRSFNTGNPTRLVRKEQPDRSPFKVCELIPHDSMPPGWAVESCQADAFDGKTGQTPFPRSSPNWTYPGHHKTDANDPIRTLATPLAPPEDRFARKRCGTLWRLTPLASHAFLRIEDRAPSPPRGLARRWGSSLPSWFRREISPLRADRLKDATRRQVRERAPVRDSH